MVKLENILFFDIETAPSDEKFSEESPFWDTWRNKLRKHNYTNDELLNEYHTTAGLFAEYGKIVCISAGFLNGDKFRVKSFSGNEKDLIVDFLEMVEKFVGMRGSVQFSGHNITDFDIPFIRQSFCKYFPLVDYPQYLCDIDLSKLDAIKPWVLTERFIDTLKIQKGSRFNFSSMAETALSLGLPSPKLDTDGSKVGKLFVEGKIKDIETYCEGDVYTTYCILSKWLGQPIFEKLSVTDDKIEKPTILQKAITSGLKKEDEDKLNKVIKKLTKKEQEIAKDIIIAATSKTKLQK